MITQKIKRMKYYPGNPLSKPQEVVLSAGSDPSLLGLQEVPVEVVFHEPSLVHVGLVTVGLV